MAGGDILFAREGGLAVVTLNRPAALNAFTLAMYRAFDPMLRRWADDPSVRAVLIQGAAGRAFCAGGDIRALYEAGRGLPGDRRFTADFFREEYTLIRRVHRYPKPYIAIVDGIAMGGGVGVSINGRWRVVTEHAGIAMPETGIGLFPDVGATRFLNLCPGRIGRWLGLTGTRIGGADALYCGLATHFVPRDRVPALVAALASAASIEDALTAFAADPGEPPLKERHPAIDRCFAAPTVEAILDALAAEAQAGGADAGWAEATRAGLLAKSPTSLKIALRQLTIGQGFDIEAALTLEYRLTQRIMQNHDFYEGVRATLIDRGRPPRWQPATLAGVTDVIVDEYFAPLGDGELRFANKG
jgi:enoyl-CoA hydratase